MSDQPVFDFDGETYEPEFDKPRLNTLLGKVFVLMEDRQYRTLSEIQSVVACGSEASISARLRDLRKPRFGGYEVDRRRRGKETKGLFEYQLRSPTPTDKESKT